MKKQRSFSPESLTREQDLSVVQEVDFENFNSNNKEQSIEKKPT